MCVFFGSVWNDCNNSNCVIAILPFTISCWWKMPPCHFRRRKNPAKQRMVLQRRLVQANHPTPTVRVNDIAICVTNAFVWPGMAGPSKSIRNNHNQTTTTTRRKWMPNRRNHLPSCHLYHRRQHCPCIWHPNGSHHPRRNQKQHNNNNNMHQHWIPLLWICGRRVFVC